MTRATSERDNKMIAGVRQGEDGPSSGCQKHLRRENKNLQREDRGGTPRREDDLRSSSSRDGRPQECDETNPERVSRDERLRQVHGERDERGCETAKADLERVKRNSEKRRNLDRRSTQRGIEMPRVRPNGSPAGIAPNFKRHTRLYQVNILYDVNFAIRKTTLFMESLSEMCFTLGAN